MDQPLEISVSLNEAALYELELLRTVYSDKFLRHPAVVQNAIYRYENYWLPFLNRHSTCETGDLEFAAPLDILWIWHTHMLSPLNYKKNCNQIFQRVFGHELCSNERLGQKRAETKLLWVTDYPDEPYDVARSKSIPPRDQKLAIEFDLMAATKRKKLFYYQVYSNLLA